VTPGPVAARFLESRRGLLGLGLVASVALGGGLVQALDRHAPLDKDVARGLSPLGAPLPPSLEWPLGTDVLGRCEAARLGAAAFVTLEIGLLAALAAVVIGTGVGLWAGWAGGAADAALMRLCDVVLAFPFVLIVVAAAALLGGTEGGRADVALVLGLVGWTTVARVCRARTAQLRRSELVAAARVAGAGPVRILVAHVLPNVVGTVITIGSVAVAQMIVAESTLSFLGLGAPPPAATLGRMIAEGQTFLRGAPWLVVAPGVVVVAAALGFNLLGDGLRDAFDPRGAR
jgi:peptide/nickel transport system permease protein